MMPTNYAMPMRDCVLDLFWRIWEIGYLHVVTEAAGVGLSPKAWERNCLRYVGAGTRRVRRIGLVALYGFLALWYAFVEIS